MNKITNIVNVWDTDLKILYPRKKFTSEIIKILTRLKLDSNSKILDASAGTGFPALELIKEGFQITINDASVQMLNLLKSNVKKSSLKVSRIYNLPWHLLDKSIKSEFDLVFCRGNSLIYAKSWHKKLNTSEGLQDDIILNLRNFYNLLNPGGILWVDITSDKEISTGPKIVNKEKGKVDGIKFQSTWKIYHDYKRKLRTVNINIDYNHKKYSHTLYSYLLNSSELKELLKIVGFKKIRKIKPKYEIYTVLIAQKNF